MSRLPDGSFVYQSSTKQNPHDEIIEHHSNGRPKNSESQHSEHSNGRPPHSNGRPPDNSNNLPPDHSNGRPPNHSNGRPPEHSDGRPRQPKNVGVFNDLSF